MGAACSRCSPAADEEAQKPDLVADGAGVTPNGTDAVVVPNGYTAPSKQAVPSRATSTAGSVYYDANDGDGHGTGARQHSACLSPSQQCFVMLVDQMEAEGMLPPLGVICRCVARDEVRSAVSLA